MTEKTIDHRLAWLAGIIDGEGWIGFTIRRTTRQSKGIRRSPITGTRKRGPTHYEYASWYVAVANTDPAMLCEIASIADVLGARYCYQLTQRVRGNRKEQQRVSFAAKRDIKRLLEAVFPYLINKRPQAELTLRAMAHRYGSDARAISVRNCSALPVRLDNEFREMAKHIHRLNQRGLGLAPTKEM